MDLLLIATRIWRYRFITVPLMLLTLLGGAYVAKVKKPVYQVSATYLLVNPPAPPTQQEITADPTLAHVRADNPYTRFGNDPVMIDVLSRTMTTPTARDKLYKEGADPNYVVESTMTYGFATPVLQITASGTSPQAASRTATIVSRAVLAQLQALQHMVDRTYRISAQLLQPPTLPLPQASGRVRSLVAVLAVGMIVLFSAISVADALAAIRRQRMRPAEDVVAPGPDRGAPQPIASNGRGGKLAARG